LSLEREAAKENKVAFLNEELIVEIYLNSVLLLESFEEVRLPCGD